MQSLDVYSLGNALVDVEYEVTPQELERLGIDKGVMTLVEEERHDFLLKNLHGKSHNRASGGSAANSIIALAQLGGKAFYSGRVADDEAGAFYRHDLEQAGVLTNIDGTANGSGGIAKTGKCLVMITPDADRTMNTYLGISSELNAGDIDHDALASAAYLYLEGYLVSSPPALEAMLTAKRLARENDTRIAFTLSDPNMVRFFREGLLQVLEGGVDLLFCNRDEALEFTGQTQLDEAVSDLSKLASQVVVTLGAEGAIYRNGASQVQVEPVRVRAVDTNGAGDMFAGTILYGLTRGMSVEDSGRLASLTSARLVEHFGPRLDQKAMDKVKAEFSA